jgi:hypothetical protein
MDYDETWKHEVSTHETEKEAEEVAESLRNSSPWWDEWYEVEEE